VDDSAKIPLVFANRVIRLFANNQLSEDVMILPDDYMTMRLVFRKCGGSWEMVGAGGVPHVNLLAKIVAAWGRNRRKERKVEFV